MPRAERKLSFDAQFAQRMRRARGAHQWTPFEAAVEITKVADEQVNENRYRQWERADRMPHVSLIPAICTAFGISPDWLLGMPMQSDLSGEELGIVLRWRMIDEAELRRAVLEVLDRYAVLSEKYRLVTGKTTLGQSSLNHGPEAAPA